MLKVQINDNLCKGCGLCVSICPKKILQLSPNKINSKGYSPAECTDQEACISCAFCGVMCPDVAIQVNG